MNDEILARIREWCEADPSLVFGAGDPPTVTLTGDRPLEMRLAASASGVDLVHDLPDHGPISRSLGAEPARHTFMAAVYDLAAAAERARTEAEAARQRAAQEAAAQAAAAQAAAAQTAAAAAPADTGPTQVTFAPTHRVPASGTRAWAQPDPSQQPVAELAGGVELRVDEMQGAWAKVTGSNGWTGWVDGRLLEGLSAAPAQAAVPTAAAAPASGLAAMPVRLVPLLGAIVLGVSVFLSTVSFPTLTNNALDFPLDATWSRNELLKRLFGFTDSEILTIGLALLVLTAVGLAVAFVKQIPVWVGRIAGGLALLVLVGFAISWGKFTTNDAIVSSAGNAIGRPLDGISVLETITQSLAIGFWLGVLGSVILIVGGPSRR